MVKRALHPVDIPVALHLLEASRDSFAKLASDLEISSSTAHESVRRLLGAGLVRHGLQGERAVNRHALVEFLTHGVRYAFRTALGKSMRGVATAHAGPALRDAFVAEEAVVWPALDGDSVSHASDPQDVDGVALTASNSEFNALQADLRQRQFRQLAQDATRHAHRWTTPAGGLFALADLRRSLSGVERSGG